ncbi:MAG: ABC transporter substrate-binding protein [Anaerolineae bacterium]
MKGGTVVEGGLAEAATLNPILATDSASLRLIDKMFDSLLTVDPQNGALRPGLAAAWQISGQTVTFTLRSDVLWHDGKTLTAEDVAFTFEAVLSPTVASPLAPALTAVQDFAALNKDTFVVRLSEAGCPILYDLGRVGILPRHLLADQDIPTSPFNTRSPVGSGPFMFKERSPGEHITLAKNPRYYRGAPRLDAWTFKVVADEEELLAGLKAGELDVAYLRPEDLSEVEALGRFEIYRYPVVGRDADATPYYFIAYNNDHPILGDRWVRRALSYALDRQRLIDVILDGQGEPLAVGLPPGHWAHPKNLAPYPFDPQVARRILAQTGWTDSDGDGILDKDGQPFRLGIIVNAENEVRQTIAVLAQGYYHAIGVAAEVRSVEWSTFLVWIFLHEFDVAIFSWPLKLDPDQTLLWRSDENALYAGFNFVSYRNSWVDFLLKAGRFSPDCDREARTTIYHWLQQELAYDQPYDFLFTPYELLAVNRRITGLAPSPFAGPFWNVAKWYVAQ